MIKRKKIIAMIIAASSVSMFAVGCSNNTATEEIYSVEDLKIKDISKAYEPEYSSYFEGQSTYNSKFVEKYDNLELVSYKVSSFDEKTLEYNVDFTFKNKSNKKLNDLTVTIDVFGEYGGFGSEEIKIKSLEAKEQCVKTVKFSLSELANSVVEYSEDDISDTDYKKAIEKAIKNKSFEGGFNYKYNTIDSIKGLQVSNSLDFDGNVTGTNVQIYNEIDEKGFKNVKTTHVENGSYLNLVNPENKKYFDDIIVKNIEVKINDEFDFEITAKFKNNGNKEIKDFTFEPSLNVLGSYAYEFSEDDLKQINTYSDKVIKPGEEFEITATAYGSFITLDTLTIDTLKEVKGFDLNSKKETFINLIENRLISVGYMYSYNDDEFDRTTNAVFSNTGKMEDFYSYEFPLEDSFDESDEF